MTQYICLNAAPVVRVLVQEHVLADVEKHVQMAALIVVLEVVLTVAKVIA